MKTGFFTLSLAYALREMRAGLRGFYIFLVCLVLGVGTISGVQALSHGMSESLSHDGRFILGGDLDVHTLYGPPSEEQLGFMRRELGPVSTVFDVMSMARREDQSKSSVVEIKAVDAAYPPYGSVAMTDSKGAPVTADLHSLLRPAEGKPGAVAESTVLTRLGIGVGDDIWLGDAAFTVRAVLVKEPDRVSTSYFSLAPHVMIRAEHFAATGLGGPGSRMDFKTRIMLQGNHATKDLEAAEDKLRTAFPQEEWRIRNFHNASPRTERLIDRLTLFLTLIGLTTLLIGGVGISNAVKAFLDGKLSHIAMLKCLGAPQRFIFMLYLAQILLLAAAGILVGILIGTGGAQMAGAFIADELGMTDRMGFYPAGALLAAAFGLLVTLCFCLWPLGRAVRTGPVELFRDLVTPRHATPGKSVAIVMALLAAALAALVVATSPLPLFAIYFVAGVFIAFAVFATASGAVQSILRRASLPARQVLRLAAANLHRPGNATTSVVLSLGLGLTVLVAMAQVEYNFSRLLADDMAVDTPSFFFLDIQPSQKEAFAALIAKESAARNLVMTPSLRGRIVAVNGVPAEKALVDRSEEWVIRSDRSFTYTTALPAHSEITDGVWWPADYKGPPAVSIASDVARAFDIGPKDKLTISVLGLDITAEVMNVREIEWASFTMNFAVTFAPGALENAPAASIATAIVDPAAEERLQADISAQFPNVTSLRVREALETVQGLVRTVASAVSLSAAITLAAGTLVLAGGIAAARRRQVREAVILKVLGATRKKLAAVFLAEYALLGLLTVAIAALLGTLGSWAVLRFVLDLPWKFSMTAVMSVAALCLGITLVAGFLGTWRAMGQKPAPFLRAE